MIKLIRTNAGHKEFLKLVKFLDKDLKIRDGDEHEFYAKYNKLDQIQHVVIAIKEEEPVGCGAFKVFSKNVIEIKRMYVSPDARGNGIAYNILTELENWAYDLNYHASILETGVNQPEAINLYNKCGYQRISNYGQYTNAASSLCFEKILG